MARLGLNSGLGSTGISSNDYNGGAVVFNLQPYVQYSVNQKLRDQAREDAFYKYFGSLGSSLTPAGMHTKDIPGLMQQKNDWQNFMMQNREAVARPGLDQGKAYTEAMSRYNNMMAYINQSKNDVKNLASLKPILDSPQKKYLLNDVTMQRIHQASLPIGDPNYQPFDPSTIDFNPPQFDAKQANQMRLNMSQYKPSDNPTVIPLPNHQEQLIHNYKFNKNDLNGIYTQGAMAYHTNPSFQGEIDKVKDDPTMHGQLNSLFNEHYGRDMQSPEDAAAAYMLSLHPDISNKVEQPRNIPYSPWETAAAGFNREKQFYDYKSEHPTAIPQQEWVSQFTDAVKKGDLNTLKKLESPLFSGNGKNTINNKNGYVGIDYGAYQTGPTNDAGGIKNVAAVKRFEKRKVANNDDPTKSHYENVEVTDYLDPDDPNLSSKIVNLYQKIMGSQPKMEEGEVKKSLGQSSSTPNTHTSQRSQKTTFGAGGLN